MKRLVLLGWAVIAFTVAYSQEGTMGVPSSEPVLKSKRGIAILPEEGEWALGISATPFLTYTGNILNGNVNNVAPGFNFVNNPTNSIALFGKYIVDANTAYRVRFNASVNTQLDKAVIALNEVDPDVNFPAFTEDWRKTDNQTVVLAAGLEKRRGKSRVQGIYGGELVLGMVGQKRTYQYGNTMSQDFNVPTTNNFGDNNVVGVTRVLENKTGAVLFAAARGFIGVEYFIAPKFSIGGEFGYSFTFRTAARTLVTTERWDALTNSIQEIKTDVGTPANYNTFLGTSLDNLNGSINIVFYF
jgi:hypothetical protein